MPPFLIEYVLMLLHSLKRHLEPFAIAANVTQSDSARLDVVLVTLANLFRIYSNSHLDNSIQQTVLQLASLEKRWANADQHIFILAVVFNPYIRIQAFHPRNSFRTMGGVWPLVKAAYLRFFNDIPDYHFRTAFGNYIAGVGDWSPARMSLDELRQEARSNVSSSLTSTTFSP